MTDRRLAAALFLLAWVTFAWFYGGAGWNQDAHFDLTRAIVERQTLWIDGYDVNTGDIARGRDGHVFINKPPGVSFLAAVTYALVYSAERIAGAPVDALTRANQWIVTAATSGLCGALIAPLLYLHARRRFDAPARDAAEAAMVVVFGTIVFAYSTMLFSHVPAALFLLLAVTAYASRPLLAGVAAGLAVVCFYVCAVGAAILALAAARRSRRALLSFVAGTAPLLLLLGAYQWYCFGSPLRTSVESSAGFTDPSLLFGVLGLPRLEALHGLTFSPWRGLFFASPVLLAAIPGGVVMARRREYRQDLAVAAAIAAAFFLVIASFNFWHGGWAFGPRYVLPVVPLFGIAMLFAVRPLRIVWIAAAIVSVAINFIATAVDPMPAQDLPNPIVRYHLPAFFRGEIAEETRRAFPWYGSRDVDRVSLPRDSGNLGEFLFGEGRGASVIPVAIWLIGGAAAILIAARRTAPRSDEEDRETTLGRRKHA